MKKAIIITIVVLLIAAASYFLFFMMTKEKAIKLIIKASPTRTAASLSGFDDAYLIEWGKALRGNDPSFTTGGKTYDSATGKAK